MDFKGLPFIFFLEALRGTPFIPVWPQKRPVSIPWESIWQVSGIDMRIFHYLLGGRQKAGTGTAHCKETDGLFPYTMIPENPDTDPFRARIPRNISSPELGNNNKKNRMLQQHSSYICKV